MADAVKLKVTMSFDEVLALGDGDIQRGMERMVAHWQAGRRDWLHGACDARIRELEDALRLAEPLLPPNAPWGIVSKVRKALDRGVEP